MQVEFRNFLKNLIKDWLADRDIKDLEISNFQISTPPCEANAYIGTNLVFILAKKLGKEPKALTKEIASIQNENFELFSAPSGYLNAIPKRDFLKTYFLKIEQLIKTNSFLSYTTSVDAIFNSKNEDLRELIRLKPNLDFNDILMALALNADSELNVQAYLIGLKGKENIPWLLERFSRDWKAIATCHDGFSEQASLLLSDLKLNQLILDLDFQADSLEQVARHQLLALMNFRNFDKIEHLLPYCLRLIDKFYLYYNQPYFRSAIARKELGLVGSSTAFLGMAIDSVARFHIKY